MPILAGLRGGLRQIVRFESLRSGSTLDSDSKQGVMVMSLTGMLLMTNSHLFTLVALWLTGALLVVGVFLVNRSRIKHDEDSHQH